MSTEQAIDTSAIASWLAEYSGISASIIGNHSLQRAVGERLKATGFEAGEPYLEHLLASPEEQQNLVDLVVVAETWFFRDRQPFVHLRNHVDQLIAAGLPSQPLRLLSAPCSTGEEPYSIAMTLLDMGLPADSFKVDAIDICRRSIRKARHAVHGKHSFRGVSEDEKTQHFQPTPQGLALNPAIRSTIHFKSANLMRCLAETASTYDVIFCRNLLIYLEEAASQHLLQSFAALMRPGALLIVGSAETGKVPPELFQSIRESFVFGFLRRNEQPSPAPAVAAGEPAPPSPRRRLRPATRKAAPVQESAAAARRRALRSAPAVGRGAGTAAAPTRSRPGDPGASRAASGQELEECRQELKRNPYCDATYLRLAKLLEQGNHTDEAIDCLQCCLYLQPNSRQALEAMIQITGRAGQIERSRQFQGRLARLLSSTLPGNAAKLLPGGAAACSSCSWQP